METCEERKGGGLEKGAMEMRKEMGIGEERDGENKIERRGLRGAYLGDKLAC